MIFARRQPHRVAAEPQPLDTPIDQPSAELWEEYMGNGRGYDQLYHTWKDPDVTNKLIRQRAVVSLTLPQDASLPFSHPNQAVGRLLHLSEVIEGTQTSSLRRRLKDRPDLADELAKSALYWLDKAGHDSSLLLDSRVDYSRLTRQLLPIVKPDQANRLYDYYPMNDPDVYWDQDDASGYHPLMNLLHDEAVPAVYKHQAVDAWVVTAKREESGQSRPRQEHERAIKVMRDFVASYAYSQTADDGLEVKLISFLEAQAEPGEPYVSDYEITQIASHIDDSELKYAFSRRHLAASVSATRFDFKVTNEFDRSFVVGALASAHEHGDDSLDTRVAGLLAEYATLQALQQAASQREAELQSRLRAS